MNSEDKVEKLNVKKYVSFEASLDDRSWRQTKAKQLLGHWAYNDMPKRPFDNAASDQLRKVISRMMVKGEEEIKELSHSDISLLTGIQEASIDKYTLASWLPIAFFNRLLVLIKSILKWKTRAVTSTSSTSTSQADQLLEYITQISYPQKGNSYIKTIAADGWKDYLDKEKDEQKQIKDLGLETLPIQELKVSLDNFETEMFILSKSEVNQLLKEPGMPYPKVLLDDKEKDAASPSIQLTSDLSKSQQKISHLLNWMMKQDEKLTVEEAAFGLNWLYKAKTEELSKLLKLRIKPENFYKEIRETVIKQGLIKATKRLSFSTIARYEDSRFVALRLHNTLKKELLGLS